MKSCEPLLIDAYPKVVPRLIFDQAFNARLQWVVRCYKIGVGWVVDLGYLSTSPEILRADAALGYLKGRLGEKMIFDDQNFCLLNTIGGKRATSLGHPFLSSPPHNAWKPQY